ncbi:hypothetical protein FHL15_005598 [Xylaria flabelliformis]|uniref:Uncharacterized protein n=1 Tax=Xylaria flabelliformis TaxID=2512241 RepID=A0A553I094_9PEZI|nr:hypothetical protein FHL15_005598 [Xylaria flabelliformis]
MSGSEGAPELTKPLTFCNAIFFFYACGCRAPEPFFCCRPHPDDSSGAVKCRHETPSVIIAKLPHASVDPASLEFVREVDTAERIDLAILGNIPQDEIDSLPERVDGTFTAAQVASRWRARQKALLTFSPDAVPFVPKSYAAAPTPTPASELGDVTTLEGPSDTVEEKLVESAKEGTDNAEQDEECQQDGECQQDTKSEKLQSDPPVIAEEMVCEEVARPDDDDDDDSESSEEFFDTEQNAASESSVSSRETTPKPEEQPGSSGTLATDAISYDEMMLFWALVNNETASQTNKASSWGISSLLGGIGDATDSRQGRCEGDRDYT